LIFWSTFLTLYLNSDRNTDYKTAEIMLYNPFLVKVTPISSIIRKIRPNLNIKGIFLYFLCHFFDYFFQIFCIFRITFWIIFWIFCIFCVTFCINLGILWLFFVFVCNCLYFVIILCNCSYLY
jgi:hypothetical protein